MSFLPNMLLMLDARAFVCVCVCDALWTHRMASQSHEKLYNSSNWTQWFTLSFIIQILVAAGSKLRTKPKKQKRNEWKVSRTHNDHDMHDVVYCLLTVSSAHQLSSLSFSLSLSPSLFSLANLHVTSASQRRRTYCVDIIFRSFLIHPYYLIINFVGIARLPACSQNKISKQRFRSDEASIQKHQAANFLPYDLMICNFNY